MSNEIKLVITIVDRGKGDHVADFLRERNVFFNTVLLGRGTAASHLADLLGTGDCKKDVVVSVVPHDRVTEILKDVTQQFHIYKPGHGVAFVIDITSISSRRALDYSLANSDKN
jgi:nitrogen regulatory protein PII